MAPAVEAEGRWDIVHVGHLKAASEIIRYKQPGNLAITLDTNMTDADQGNLRRLLALVGTHFKGRLDLDFWYSFYNFQELKSDVMGDIRDAE